MPKNNLLPIVLLDAVSMGTSVNSSAVPIMYEDNIGLQFVWTGANPAGTIAVQLSQDQDTWSTMSFTPSINQPSGSAGDLFIDINQTGAAYIRVSFTTTGGSVGTLTCTATGKAV